MTDPKAIAQEIKARHNLVTDVGGTHCPECDRIVPEDGCDAVLAADALLEVAEDKARLDWLDPVHACASSSIDREEDGTRRGRITFRYIGAMPFGPIRAAIDAARNSTPSTQEKSRE